MRHYRYLTALLVALSANSALAQMPVYNQPGYSQQNNVQPVTYDNLNAILAQQQREIAQLRAQMASLSTTSSVTTNSYGAVNYATAGGGSACDTCAESCCSQRCGWLVTASYLHLKPTVDDTYFVINSPVTTTFPSGTRADNDMGFNPAFRVGAGYDFGGDDGQFMVAYTRLDTDESRTVDGDFLWATRGRADLTSSFENYTGQATSDLELEYNRVDMMFSRPIWRACRSELSLLYGLEYAKMEFTESYVYVSTVTGTVDQSAESWGIGPQLGLDMNCAVWQGSGSLSLNIMFAASLLAGESESFSNNNLAGTTLLNVSDESTSRVIPALHARIGMNYDTCCLGCDSTLSLGYQFDSYINALTRTEYPDDVADGLSFTRFDNFDLQGLYVTGVMKF